MLPTLGIVYNLFYTESVEHALSYPFESTKKGRLKGLFVSLITKSETGLSLRDECMCVCVCISGSIYM